MGCRKCPGINLCPCTIRDGSTLMWLDVMGSEYYNKEGASTHPEIEPAARRLRIWEQPDMDPGEERNTGCVAA